MTFSSEKEFEEHIRQVLTKKVLPLNKNLVMLKNKKAVDILICKNGKKPLLFFIEIKYHKLSHDRLSTGHGAGGGIQPEILQLQPEYFKKQMIWILGIETKAGYWILNNEELMGYIAGGKIGIKYNNIQTRLFKDKEPYTEKQLIASLKKWLL